NFSPRCRCYESALNAFPSNLQEIKCIIRGSKLKTTPKVVLALREKLTRGLKGSLTALLSSLSIPLYSRMPSMTIKGTTFPHELKQNASYANKERKRTPSTTRRAMQSRRTWDKPAITPIAH